MRGLRSVVLDLRFWFYSFNLLYYFVPVFFYLINGRTFDAVLMGSYRLYRLDPDDNVLQEMLMLSIASCVSLEVCYRIFVKKDIRMFSDFRINSVPFSKGQIFFLLFCCLAYDFYLMAGSGRGAYGSGFKQAMESGFILNSSLKLAGYFVYFSKVVLIYESIKRRMHVIAVLIAVSAILLMFISGSRGEIFFVVLALVLALEFNGKNLSYTKIASMGFFVFIALGLFGMFRGLYFGELGAEYTSFERFSIS